MQEPLVPQNYSAGPRRTSGKSSSSSHRKNATLLEGKSGSAILPSWGLYSASRNNSGYQQIQVRHHTPRSISFAFCFRHNPKSHWDSHRSIKDRLVSNFSEKSESKLRRLLKEQILGDQKPSHFLQHLKNLAADQYVKTVVKSLFLEQFPQQVSAILTGRVKTDLAN